MGGTVDDIVNVKISEERRYRLLCAHDDSLRVRRLIAVRLSAFIGASAVGFVGASSLERMGVEASLTNLTKEFKRLKAPAAKKFGKKVIACDRPKRLRRVGGC